MNDMLQGGRRLLVLYFLDICWVLGFIFLSFAIPFMTAVQHSDFPNWPAWDKHLLLLGCAVSSVTTTMALFKQLGRRLRAGQALVPDDDDLPATIKPTAAAAPQEPGGNQESKQDMNKLKTVILAGTLALAASLTTAARAQDAGPTNAPPTIQSGFQSIVDAMKAGQTNWDFAAYGLYAKSLQHHYGGGIGAFYPLSQYVLTGVRMDYVNGGFWMPSGNATLQLPIKLTSWLTVTPFGYAGVGIPVSGAKVGDFNVPGSIRDNNGDPTAILGYGAAVRLWTGTNASVSLVGDRESWSGFAGQQYRLGLVYKRTF